MANNYSLVLEIGSGVLSASSGLKASEETRILLTGVEGWDEFPEFERNSVKRILGDGEIPSKLTTFNGKRIKFYMFAQWDAKHGNIRVIRTNLSNVANRLNDTTDVKLITLLNGKETFREVLKCLPDTPFIETWNPVDNGIEFSVSFFAPNPWKQVSTNGSPSGVRL